MHETRILNILNPTAGSIVSDFICSLFFSAKLCMKFADLCPVLYNTFSQWCRTYKIILPSDAILISLDTLLDIQQQ